METRTSKVTYPQTILQTLERTLGDDAYLLNYLPKGTVVGVDPTDALEGHVAYRIELGTVQEAKGIRVKVYAYMSTFSRLRDLPEVYLRGCHPLGALKQFRLETVVSEGELHVAFEHVKQITAAAMKSLLHCLFMIHGATFPSDCAILQSFLTDIRSVCYLYKNGSNGRSNERFEGVRATSTALVGDGEEDIASYKLSSVPVSEASPAFKAITPTARKRRYCSFSNSLPMPDDSNSTAMHSSPGRPPMSPLTSPVERNPIADRMVADILDARHEYGTYIDLQEKLMNIDTDLTLINGKDTATKVERIVRLTVLTGTISAKLGAQHEGEDLTLSHAHKAEMEKLKHKQATEERALYEKHVHEFKVARQEHAELEFAFQEKEAALFEEKSAMLQERDRLEAESERKLKAMTAMPDWHSFFNEEVRQNIRTKRMKLESGKMDARGEGN